MYDSIHRIHTQFIKFRLPLPTEVKSVQNVWCLNFLCGAYINSQLWPKCSICGYKLLIF